MRLIDADALPIKYDGHCVGVWKNDLDAAPTVDAVPVVRCRDCINYKFDYCLDTISRVTETDFCSNGKRKEVKQDGLN